MTRNPWMGSLLCSLALTLTTLAQEPSTPPAAGPATTAPVTVEPCFGALVPRVSLRHDVGDGVGYDNGFTYLEGWMPLLQRPGSHVLFADLRVVNFDNRRYWEYNGGGGFRYYSDKLDRIFGANLFYDGRDGSITDNAFANVLNGVSLVQGNGALRLVIDRNTFTNNTHGVFVNHISGDLTLGIRLNRFSGNTNDVVDSGPITGVGTQCLQLANNVGTTGYVLQSNGGLFQVEDLLGTNTPAPTVGGGITIVPAGFCGFPLP